MTPRTTASPRFAHAIVRQPARSMIDGLTSVDLGRPDPDRAARQHRAYVDALEACGLEVTVLPADERFPDSVFVEDTALLTPRGAILTRPGAASRWGETALIAPAIHASFSTVSQIESPGTVEAGDILMVGDHYYIGLSERTNQAGAEQMIEQLRSLGLDGTIVHMQDMLHLKTGVSYLEHNRLTCAGEFIDHPAFEAFERIAVPDAEAYAACALWINDTVLVPSGHPRTRQKICDLGYPVIDLQMSEFQKIDGGLSCLSLRY